MILLNCSEEPISMRNLKPFNARIEGFLILKKTFTIIEKSRVFSADIAGQSKLSVMASEKIDNWDVVLLYLEMSSVF